MAGLASAMEVADGTKNAVQKEIRSLRRSAPIEMLPESYISSKTAAKHENERHCRTRYQEVGEGIKKVGQRSFATDVSHVP